MKHNVSYKWNPEEYAKYSMSQQIWARELINRLMLKGNEKILDIGCGDAKITKEIADQVPHGEIIGLDSSAEMIQYAASRYPYHIFQNMKFMTMDAREMNFIDEFDVVFSNAALHWIIDHSVVLPEIYRALKHNGKVLVQMGGKGNALSVIEILDEIIESEKWKEYFYNFIFPYGFYSPEEYSPLLKEAGFKVLRIELVQKERIHDDSKDFKGWMRTQWIPYLYQLPDYKKEEFIDEVTQKYITKYAQNGKIAVTMKRLEFEAIKK